MLQRRSVTTRDCHRGKRDLLKKNLFALLKWLAVPGFHVNFIILCRSEIDTKFVFNQIKIITL